MLVKNIHLPKLMGIVNGTPDSFYHKSRIDKLSINSTNFQYADIVDVGYESSRPGSDPLSEKYEICRLEHFLTNYSHFHHTLSFILRVAFF